MEVYPPLPNPTEERRANDSLVVILMQEVHHKIDAMDAKLTQHITDETLILAEEISALMIKAFPQGDPDGHRVYHEASIKAAGDRAEFWKQMRMEISKWGLIGMLGWGITLIWKRLVIQ